MRSSKTGPRECTHAAAWSGDFLCVSVGEGAWQGAEEGAKDSPCAIVAARQLIEGREVVTVVPITHTPPTDLADAVEIPPALKARLGLDDLPSWIVVTETIDFLCPGPDLRPRRGITPSRFDYGMLPPRFYAHVRERMLQAHLHRRLNRVPRTDGIVISNYTST